VRLQFGALIAGAKTQTDDIHIVAGSSTIDLRAAVATKHHDSRLTATARFGIGPWGSPAQVKFIHRNVHARSKRRTGQDLTAVTMADTNLVRIYVRLVREFTAVAASSYFHGNVIPFGLAGMPFQAAGIQSLNA